MNILKWKFHISAVFVYSQKKIQSTVPLKYNMFIWRRNIWKQLDTINSNNIRCVSFLRPPLQVDNDFFVIRNFIFPSMLQLLVDDKVKLDLVLLSYSISNITVNKLIKYN